MSEHTNPPAGRLATRLGGLGRPELALAALVAVAAVWRSLLAFQIEVPWIAPDEPAYALLGRGFWQHGELAILGGPTQFFSALYPVLAGVPLELGGLGAGYDVLRVLQVLALCSTAVVVYAWARMLVQPPWALVGAALTLVLPGLTYAGTITAEVLLVPLATLAAWAAVRALEAPTTANQALLLAALGACLLTRLEANVLLIAVVVAAVARRRLAQLVPTWIAFALLVVAWLVLGAGSPLRSMGGYSSPAGYTPLRVVEFVGYHAGDLLLACGVVPLCAVVLLALARPRDPVLRSSLAVILAIAVVAVVEVGVFAAGHAGRLVERELLFVLPPLMVGFVAWLGRGAPRPRVATPAVAAAAFAGLIALPIGTLATTDALTDNPSIVPLIRVDGPQAYGLTALGAGVACALLLWARGRAVWLLPLALGATFVAVSISASHEFAHQSRLAQSRLGETRSWIDRSTDDPVTYVYDGSDWSLAWQELLWNERIGRVLDLAAARVPGPLPQGQLEVLGDGGDLRLVAGEAPRERLLVVPRGMRLDGRPVATGADLVLWRLDGAPRVTTWTQGLLPNGDVGNLGLATLDVYGCGRGRFHLVAIGRDYATLRLTRDGATVGQVRLWPHGVWEKTIETPARARGRCSFELSSTSLVHLAAFSWKPAG